MLLLIRRSSMRVEPAMRIPEKPIIVPNIRSESMHTLLRLDDQTVIPVEYLLSYLLSRLATSQSEYLQQCREEVLRRREMVKNRQNNLLAVQNESENKHETFNATATLHDVSAVAVLSYAATSALAAGSIFAGAAALLVAGVTGLNRYLGGALTKEAAHVISQWAGETPEAWESRLNFASTIAATAIAFGTTRGGQNLLGIILQSAQSGLGGIKEYIGMQAKELTGKEKLAELSLEFTETDLKQKVDEIEQLTKLIHKWLMSQAKNLEKTDEYIRLACSKVGRI